MKPASIRIQIMYSAKYKEDGKETKKTGRKEKKETHTKDNWQLGEKRKKNIPSSGLCASLVWTELPSGRTGRYSVS